MMKPDKGTFRITNDDDEVRVDGLCRDLLREFHGNLLERGTEPLEAGCHAHGADYFLRDFVVSARRCNPFDEAPGLVRRFAATWYIISTLEPSIRELSGLLKGVRELFRFLLEEGLISADYWSDVERECADIPYYEERIESFLKIRGDGYLAWERECSLKNGR
jgi:hypothetical protein